MNKKTSRTSSESRGLAYSRAQVLNHGLKVKGPKPFITSSAVHIQDKYLQKEQKLTLYLTQLALRYYLLPLPYIYDCEPHLLSAEYNFLKLWCSHHMIYI